MTDSPRQAQTPAAGEGPSRDRAAVPTQPFPSRVERARRARRQTNAQPTTSESEPRQNVVARTVRTPGEADSPAPAQPAPSPASAPAPAAKSPQSASSSATRPRTTAPVQTVPRPATAYAPAANSPQPAPSLASRDAVLARAMNRAIFLANRARENGDVPVGAVVIDKAGTVLGEGWNTREAQNDPAGHAEIMAMRQAAKRIGSWRLSDLTLVVTLEPCTMCAGAIVGARVKRVAFGAWDEKAGACGSTRDVVRDSRLNHQAEVVSGVLAHECGIQLRGFFNTRRPNHRGARE